MSDLLDALKFSQWNEIGICLACGRLKEEGHNAVCRIGNAINEADQPKTIEQRLLFVAQELRAIEEWAKNNPVPWGFNDIEEGHYDRAIAKLTGNWDPTPKEPSYE